MRTLNKQELEIIQTFSSADVPESVIRASNIKGLIHGMNAAQKAVKLNTKRMESLRQDEKDGNFVGNWWNDRDDKVQDAQIDLNKSIGDLTEKSSQLLIVNTLISKVLYDQQKVLNDQQIILNEQADALKKQNIKILDQQKQLAQQQTEINKANQGLLEATGLTREQAKNLMGCVNRVIEAENKIDFSNQALHSGLTQYIDESNTRCIDRINTGFSEKEQYYKIFEQSFSNELSAQSQYVKNEVERLSAEASQSKLDLEQRLGAGFYQQDQRNEKFNNELLIQLQSTHDELDRWAMEAAQFKTALEQRLKANFSEQDQRSIVFEQKLNDAFSTQSQHAQEERKRLATEANQFKADLEQKFKANFAEQEQRHEIFEQKLNNKFSAQVQHLQEECERLATEESQFKAALEQHLSNGIADQDQHRTAFERNFMDVFSVQSENTEVQLERVASSSAEFKANVEQQLQAHIQTSLEKNAAQDSAVQKLKEIFSAQLQKLHANVIATAEKKYVSMLELAESAEIKHITALQEQVSEINACSDIIKNTENKLLLLQVEQKKIINRNRLALAGMASLIFGSIGWQIAQHFALI